MAEAIIKPGKAKRNGRAYPEDEKVRCLLRLRELKFDFKRAAAELELPIRTLQAWKKEMGNDVYDTIVDLKKTEEAKETDNALKKLHVDKLDLAIVEQARRLKLAEGDIDKVKFAVKLQALQKMSDELKKPKTSYGVAMRIYEALNETIDNGGMTDPNMQGGRNFVEMVRHQFAGMSGTAKVQLSNVEDAPFEEVKAEDLKK